MADNLNELLKVQTECARRLEGTTDPAEREKLVEKLNRINDQLRRAMSRETKLKRK
jgi:hypothetical protein